MIHAFLIGGLPVLLAAALAYYQGRADERRAESQRRESLARGLSTQRGRHCQRL